MKEIIHSKNKELESKMIQSIKKLPNYKNLSCVNDDAFNDPILVISEKQKESLKSILL